jgi:RNA polymerase sigma-32 factor
MTKEDSEDKLLPALAKSTQLTLRDHPLSATDPLAQYVKDISRYKLLTAEEELSLVEKLVATGDVEAAKKLVLANLRLVVKIALEYRSAYQNVLDLSQEGNIGLMKAVSKYNPDKGAKLSYYASWWIKSYILKFILDNFRLVKIGTTQEQKKLFYNLMREKDRLESMGIEPSTKLIAQNLDVSESAVIEMNQRLSTSGNEASLDAPLDQHGLGQGLLQDIISDESELIEDQLADSQGLELLNQHLTSFLEDLKPRDKEIFTKRLLSDLPPSLQSIADEYGVSRERIRQIEERLINKLKVYMSQFIR